MIRFLIALACLAAIIYYLLDREFKRLERERLYKSWFTVTMRAHVQEFQNGLLVVGTSMKQTAEQLAKLKDVFREAGRVIYLPDQAKIQYIDKPEE